MVSYEMSLIHLGQQPSHLAAFRSACGVGFAVSYNDLALIGSACQRIHRLNDCRIDKMLIDFFDRR